MKFLLFNNYGSLVIAVTIFCIGMFAQSIVADEDTQTWEQLTASAVVAMKDGNNAQAQRLCNQAMKLLGEGTPGDTRLTKTYMLMGEIHRRGNGLEPAEQSYKKAIALCEKAVGPNHPDMAIPLDALANFYYFTQIRYDLVAPLYERILNIVANDPNRDDREVARRSRNLADVYRLLKQYTQAEPLYKQALALAEKQNDDVPGYLLELADFYRAWGKFDQAEAYAKRALMIREKDAGPDAALDVAVCLDYLAQIYLDWGKPEQAEPLYSRSVSLVESITDADNPDLAPRLTGLADAMRRQGKLKEAEASYKRALLITEKNLGANSPEVVVILEKYAVMLGDANRPDEAKAQLKKADSIRKSWENKGAENKDIERPCASCGGNKEIDKEVGDDKGVGSPCSCARGIKESGVPVLQRSSRVARPTVHAARGTCRCPSVPCAQKCWSP